MKSGIAVTLILIARIATVLSLFALAELAQAGENHAFTSHLLAMNEFRVESAKTAGDVLAKFFAACDPLSDSRCPSAPPRCGSEDFNVSGTGLDAGAYRSCAALGGASPGGVAGDVAQGCACSATCERTGKTVSGRWDCNHCLAVCE